MGRFTPGVTPWSGISESVGESSPSSLRLRPAVTPSFWNLKKRRQSMIQSLGMGTPVPERPEKRNSRPSDAGTFLRGPSLKVKTSL